MRQLAWNGVVFEVPDRWELARYHDSAAGSVRLVIEDSYAVRMEVEWLDAGNDAHAHRFSDRATERLEASIKKADRQIAIDGLPSDWRAVHCVYTEILPVRRRAKLGVVAHDLVTAVYAPSTSAFRCVIRLHFMPGDTERPDALTRHILASFTWPRAGDPARCWRVYDLAFQLDAGFRLESTTFDIGSKLMVFRRSGRRLYLWTLSCADRLPGFERAAEETAPGRAATAWVIGYLNGTRRVTGIVFRPDSRGGIGCRRRGLLAIVHRDELARWSFRYAVDFGTIPARNQLLIRVFNYRRASDLEWLGDAPWG